MAVGVQGTSAVGDRLLVVMEDEGQRGEYSQLWKDLECMPSPCRVSVRVHCTDMG
jgi:hypothetical protein